MKKTVFAVASLLAVLTAAGCTDSTGIFGSNTSGSFNLQTFNGQNLPALFDRTITSERDLVGESFTIYSDGTYTDSYTMRTITSSGSSDQTYRDTGNYSQNNTSFQFRDNATGNIFTGSITGNTLTVTQYGDVYVFSR